MKVKELIEALDAYDPDLEVVMFRDDDAYSLSFHDMELWKGRYVDSDNPKLINMYKTGLFLGINNIGDTELNQSGFESMEWD